MKYLKGIYIALAAVILTSFCPLAMDVITFNVNPIAYSKYKSWTPSKAHEALLGNNIVELVSLGAAYHSGEGVSQDRHKAFELFKRGADSRDEVGLFNYALYLSKGYCCEPDNATAVKILHELIYINPTFYSAYFLLGNIYQKGGNGIDKDYHKAFKVWEELSRLPDAGQFGRLNMATLYFEGKGVDTDVKKAKNLIQGDAEKGWVPAQSRLGEMLAFEKQYQEAEKWYRKVYDNSNAATKAMACYYLGNLYAEREDKAQSYNKALEFYHEGSSKNMSCKYKLAGILRDGLAGVKDQSESDKLFLEAADAGLSQAAFEVATRYYNGNGEQKDFEKAVIYFKKVLEGEEYNPNSVNAEACKKLSACYRFGRGVERNEAVADDYMSRGAQLGDPDAEEILKWLNRPQ